MGKIVFWLVIFFGVLFALRMVNVAKLKARQKREAGKPKAVEAMVQCRQCGVFLPRPDAREVDGSWRCNDPRCAARKGTA